MRLVGLVCRFARSRCFGRVPDVVLVWPSIDPGSPCDKTETLKRSSEARHELQAKTNTCTVWGTAVRNSY